MNATGAANRVLSALIALAVLAGGLLLAVEGVLAALARPGWIVPRARWADAVSGSTWQDSVVRLIAVGAVVLGLLLLIAALRRGAPGTLALPTTTDGVNVRAHRRGVEKAVVSAARRTDGVTTATAKASRRKVKVVARTSLRQVGDLQSTVRRAVDAQVADLGLDGRLRSSVSLDKRGAR